MWRSYSRNAIEAHSKNAVEIMAKQNNERGRRETK